MGPSPTPEHLAIFNGMFERLGAYADGYDDARREGPEPVEVKAEPVVVLPLSKREKREAKQAKLKEKLQPATAVERFHRLNEPDPLTVAEAAHLSGMGDDFIRRYFAKVPGVNRIPSSVHKRGVRRKRGMTIPVAIYEAEEQKWKVTACRKS
jgi:hypothetical protein